MRPWSENRFFIVAGRARGTGPLSLGAKRTEEADDALDLHIVADLGDVEPFGQHAAVGLHYAPGKAHQSVMAVERAGPDDLRARTSAENSADVRAQRLCTDQICARIGISR